ncbi:hypothetical protein [Streptomyces sp. NRRL S-350]|uniref:hypothetical protein n=1 Tax=Streptomyces sp. NRRL S-350 TaxID=1463902 RepID=UPI0004C1A5E8|nr:hypothetical protein [Streptomyces sp. NRRL S-350]
MTVYLALGPCTPRCIAPRGEHFPDERCTPAADMRKGDTVSAAGALSILLADPTTDPEHPGWVILAFDTCDPRSYPAGEVFQIRRPAPVRVAPELPEGTRRFRVHPVGGQAVDCHLWPCGKLTMDMGGQRWRSAFSFAEMREMGWKDARIEWDVEGPAPQDQPLPPTGPLALFDVSGHADAGRPDSVRASG